MNRLIIYSETIFSDRISKDLLRYAPEGSVDVIYSDEVRKNDLLLLRKNTSWNYRFRVKLVRSLVLLMRFVAPLKANRQSLKDHFLLDCDRFGIGSKITFKTIIWLVSRYKLLRSLILKISLLLIPKDVTESILDQGVPLNILVFSFGNLKSLSVLSLAANTRKTKQNKIFSMIQSWDNPSTKGYGLFRPDFTFSWTELMRAELVVYQDIKLCKSAAIGSPTFGKQHTLSNINNSKNHTKKIIFATKSPASFNDNIDVAIFLAVYSKTNQINLEVRLHPISLLRNSNELEQLKILADTYEFTLRYPNQRNGIPDLDLDKDNLANSSSPGDILVTIYSTMNLEAAYLGLNCINIDFEVCGAKKKLPRANIGIDRRQVHNQRLLSYGYVCNVESFLELGFALDNFNQKKRNYALNNSRQVIIKNECKPMFNAKKLLLNIKNYGD